MYDNSKTSEQHFAQGKLKSGNQINLQLTALYELTFIHRYIAVDDASMEQWATSLHQICIFHIKEWVGVFYVFMQTSNISLPKRKRATLW